MSWERYEEECPGCRPVLINPATGERLPDTDPAMRAVHRIWQGTTRFERQAFHRVCCCNSRQPFDLMVMQSLTTRISKAAN